MGAIFSSQNTGVKTAKLFSLGFIQGSSKIYENQKPHP